MNFIESNKHFHKELIQVPLKDTKTMKQVSALVYHNFKKRKDRRNNKIQPEYILKASSMCKAVGNSLVNKLQKHDDNFKAEIDTQEIIK